MKQLHLFKRFAALTLCAGLVTTGAFAASSVTRMIRATYSGIHITVDGVEITPKDANGNIVEPFTVDGTTYLPVRAISEALGKAVTWDEKTQTVYIGAQPSAEGVYLMADEIVGGFSVSDEESRVMTTLNDLYPCRTMFYFEDSTYDAYAVFNLHGKYKTVSFDIGRPFGNDSASTSFNIFVDGKLTQSVSRSDAAAPLHFEIDVTGVKTLKFTKTPTYDVISNGFCIGNVMAK